MTFEICNFEFGAYFMVLSKKTIEKLMGEDKLRINPFIKASLGACSYDLHLGGEGVNPESGKEVRLNPNFYLLAGEFVLIESQEYLELPNNFVGHLSTRLSAARLGLMVGFGSKLIQPGSIGKLTLEIKNLSNKEILLQKGLSLVQIYFEKLDQPVEDIKSYKVNSRMRESNLCEEIIS